MENFLWIIPAAPLAAFVFTLLTGKWLLKSQAHWPSVIGVGISMVCAYLTLGQVVGLGEGEALHQRFFSWMDTGAYSFDNLHLHVDFSVRVDQLTAIMLIVVTTVGFLVHVFSIGYMHGDGGYYRFFSYLPLFVFSMLMLVMADNYLVLFFFYEAVGLCSYLLVGFWFNRVRPTYEEALNVPRVLSPPDASLKAFVTTRVGDVGMALGIMLLWTTFGTFTFTDIFSQLDERFRIGDVSKGTVTAICLLLFCGAVGKSAQVPLQVWLPDAMAGPTPVSALIHAATMVTAGIYLVARSWPLYDLSTVGRNTVAVIGVTTCFMAATIAITQSDIKGVLAYSTLSQLGYMCFALGVGAYIPAIFHLVTHAFFKGLLFLGSGSVIHGMHDEQNVFKMGGLRKKMPITAYTFLAATLAISAVPGTSGFWSKDEIIVGSWHAGYTTITVIGLLTAVLTAFYMFRLYFLVFEGKPRYDQEHVHPHESPPVMWVPLVILAIPSLFLGALIGLPPDKGWIHTFLGKTIMSELQESYGAVTSSTTVGFAIISSALGLLGILLAYMMYMRLSPNPYRLGDRLHGLWSFLSHKWYFDKLYDIIAVKGTLALAYIAWGFDRYIIDGAVNGIGHLFSTSAQRLRRVQTGFVANYALAIALGTVLIVGIYLIWQANIFNQLFG